LTGGDEDVEVNAHHPSFRAGLKNVRASASSRHAIVVDIILTKSVGNLFVVPALAGLLMLPASISCSPSSSSSSAPGCTAAGGTCVLGRNTCAKQAASIAYYKLWKSRGAEFITEPIPKYGETRCYIRDPDGYIIEVGQSTDLTYG